MSVILPQFKLVATTEIEDQLAGCTIEARTAGEYLGRAGCRSEITEPALEYRHYIWGKVLRLGSGIFANRTECACSECDFH